VSHLTGFKAGLGTIIPYCMEGDLEIYTRVAFIADSDRDTVTMIAFTAEAHRPLEQGGYEDVFDSEFFGMTVDAYTLAHVLTEQGVPSVRMELFPPGQPDSFFEGLKRTDWAAKMSHDYQPLEEVTSMFMQEFYETFREPTEKCIETPAALWPVPEE
jgi:hypothetical protein